MSTMVHYEIVDQFAVLFPDVAHGDPVFQQHGSHFFDFRFEVGAVSALDRRRSTHEAENMTSQSLGSEQTCSSKLASVSSTTPSRASARERRQASNKYFIQYNELGIALNICLQYRTYLMSFSLPELPYHRDSFGKVLSAQTFEYHYGKHHQTYVTNLNSLVKGTEWENKSLDDIVANCKDSKIFNNGAQHWNHSFYWNCITPQKTELDGKLKELIVSKWGSLDNFLKDFSAQAVANFGSGWTWLAKSKEDIAIFNTSNAGNPLTNHYLPLLTVDIWEHAYYIDYRNARAKYLQNFCGMINWKFVSQNFDSDKVVLKF